MILFHLLLRESTISPWWVLFLAGVAGISNTLILVLISSVMGQGGEESSSHQIILFLSAMGIYLLSQRQVLTTTIREVDAILHRMRLRIVDKIRNAELMSLEQIGRAEIYASISKDILTISNASHSIAMMCQAAILISFTLAYIAWLSVLAFLFFVVGIAVGAGFFIFRKGRLSHDIRQGMVLENKLITGLTHLLDGFKEVKMSERRSADLYAHLSNISAAVMEVKGHVTSQLAVASVFSQSMFYFLAASVVFLLPRLSSTNADTLVQLSAGVLFLAGPIVSLVGLTEIYATANVSAENIENLEIALDHHVRPASQRQAQPLVLQRGLFSEITFDGVQFEYFGKEGQVHFTLGPINLSIARGETIFITGGNGSGKSTFLRVLTCLYFPSKGEVRIDGQRLSEVNTESYRNLFSAIFYDYHLFDRLYGLPEVDAQHVEALLGKLRLQGVTNVVDHRFAALDLSSGQKRRVALLVSYLENKPILIFDEWAAEQDPDFRRYFYTTILPELKAQGKTILVVTHDDHYYHMEYIDRIIKIQEGKIVSETEGG